MRSEPPSRPRAGPTIGGACLALGALGVLATGVRGDDKKAKGPSPEAVRQARLERARQWVTSLVAKPSFVDKTYAEWNLEALAPESGEVLIGEIEKGKLGQDSLLAACHALGELGVKKGLPTLKGLVDDEKQALAVRFAALVAIAKLLDGDSVKVLTSVASGPGGVLSRTALVMMGKTLEHTAAPIAEKALTQKDPDTRAFGLRTIGHLKDARYIPQCAAALDDPVEGVRGQAARTLGKIGTPAIADKLEKLLPKAAEGSAWRFFVAEALARLGRQKGFDTLSDYLLNGEAIYQLGAATSLFELANPKSLPVLRRVLEESLAGKRAPGPDLMCAQALGILADKDALPILVEALAARRVDMKREAITALGLLGDKKATKPLLEVVAGPEKKVRAAALVALARLGDRRAFSKEVSEALRDRDPTVRYAACVALDLVGEKGAVPELKPLLDDDQDFVARAAHDAITAIETGAPAASADTRDPLFLDRLRAVEREFLVKIQLEELGRALEPYSKKYDVKKGTYIDIVDT